MIFKIRGQKSGYISGKEKRHKVINFLVNAADEASKNDLIAGPGYNKVYFEVGNETGVNAAGGNAQVIEMSPVPAILGDETCDQLKILSDTTPGTIELIRENIAEMYAQSTGSGTKEKEPPPPPPPPSVDSGDQGSGADPSKTVAKGKGGKKSAKGKA